MDTKLPPADIVSDLLAWMKAKHAHKLVKRLFALARYLLLIGVSFILLYPLLYMLSNAVKPIEQAYDASVIWLPKSFTLDNFRDAARAIDYWDSLKTTVSVSFVSAILQIISCMLAGYGFARFQFRLKSILFALVILTIIVPEQLVAIPTYMQYRRFTFGGLLSLFPFLTGGRGYINLIDTPFVFYLPALLGAGFKSGLFIFIYRQFFRGLPRELEDSAALDGCGFTGTFLRVMLPNARPAMVTVFLFSVVWYWNEYFAPAMYMSNNWTLSTALAVIKYNLAQTSMEGSNYLDAFLYVTRVQAAALLVIAPLLIMYIFLQRFFTESIERTGIVG